MTNGYDREYYHNIRLIRHAIEKIAKVLTEPKILAVDACHQCGMDPCHCECREKQCPKCHWTECECNADEG